MNGTLVKRLIQLFAAMALIASGMSADTINVNVSGSLCLMTCAPGSGLDFPVASFQASFSLDPTLLLDTGTETLTDFNADINPVPGEGDAPPAATITPSGLCPQDYSLPCASTGVAELTEGYNEIEILLDQDMCESLIDNGPGCRDAYVTNLELLYSNTTFTGNSLLGVTYITGDAPAFVTEYVLYAGSTSASPLPEPPSTSLVAVGLGLIGFSRFALCRKLEPPSENIT